jgi:hypothetical protein
MKSGFARLHVLGYWFVSLILLMPLNHVSNSARLEHTAIPDTNTRSGVSLNMWSCKVVLDRYLVPYFTKRVDLAVCHPKDLVIHSKRRRFFLVIMERPPLLRVPSYQWMKEHGKRNSNVSIIFLPEPNKKLCLRITNSMLNIPEIVVNKTHQWFCTKKRCFPLEYVIF